MDLPIQSDGRAGKPAVAVDRLVCDDFAWTDAGVLYCATHLLNSVVRIAPDGRRATVAGNEQGVASATAVLARDDGALLVTTGDGSFGGAGSARRSARLVRLRSPDG